MKPDFLYFLHYPSIGTKQLKYAPDMSDEHALIFARDMVYHGIQRTVGINVRFVKDGYDFISTIYETYGIEAEITFTIQNLNRLKNKYEVFFEGRLNLEAYKREEFFVTVGIEESGITQRFKSRDDVLVNLQQLKTIGDVRIPPFETETVDLSLHSKTISKKFIGGTNPDEVEAVEPLQMGADASPENPLNPEKDVDWTVYVSIGFTPSVSELEDVSPIGTFIYDGIEPAAIYHVQEPGPHTLNFKFDYRIALNGSLGPGKLKNCSVPAQHGGGVWDTVDVDVIFKIKNNGVLREETVLKAYDFSGCVPVVFIEDAFNTSISRTFAFEDDISVFIKIHSFSRILREPGVFIQTIFHAEFNPSNTLEINALTQSPVPSSTANSLMWFEMGARIAQAITDQPDAFRSSLFGRTDSQPYSYASDGEASMLAGTSGHQIRGFPLSERPIHASWKDWFNTGDALFNIGAGIEDNKIVVEKKSYFYNDSVILTLSNVANITKSVAKEYYYNEIENGYAKWENEEVNGLDEFNSRRQWTTPITVIKNKLSKLSPYIGSGYAIEFTRRKTYTQTSTEDWKYDNDNFVIAVRRNGTTFEADRDQDFDSTKFANILDPSTAYNLKISPKRNLRRWGYVLRAGLEKYLTKRIKFAFGDANYKMESKLLTDESTEVENEEMTAVLLDPPLWLPEYYEFEAQVTTASLAAIKANPYGVIEFSSGSKDYLKGYIINVKVDVENKKGSFKLLRANL